LPSVGILSGQRAKSGAKKKQLPRRAKGCPGNTLPFGRKISRMFIGEGGDAEESPLAM